MARRARAEVFAPDEVAVVHVMNRVVRRCMVKKPRGHQNNFGLPSQ